MTPRIRKWLFETLYKNRYLYRFASTVPFAGQWRVWQRLVLPRLTGHDVLELGCGLGDLLADMLEAGYNCRAVEHSPAMATAARATLKKRKVGQGNWVIKGSAQNLPFPDSSFDSVVSTFPSEYIYDPATLAEVARVLRPGGRLIVVEGAQLLPVGYVQPLLVLIQTLVYGPGTLLRARKRRSSGNIQDNTDPTALEVRGNGGQKRNDAVITETLPATWFGNLIGVERFGLRWHSERVRSQRWEVYITQAEKAA